MDRYGVTFLQKCIKGRVVIIVECSQRTLMKAIIATKSIKGRKATRSTQLKQLTKRHPRLTKNLPIDDMGAHFPTGYSKAIKGNYNATTAINAITATEDTMCRYEFLPKYCYLGKRQRS